MPQFQRPRVNPVRDISPKLYYTTVIPQHPHACSKPPLAAGFQHHPFLSSAATLSWTAFSKFSNQQATQHNQPAYPLATLQTVGCTHATRVQSTKKGFRTPNATAAATQHLSSPREFNSAYTHHLIQQHSPKVSKKGIYKLEAARLATLGPPRCAPITYTSSQVLSQAYVAATVPHLQLTHHTAVPGPNCPNSILALRLAHQLSFTQPQTIHPFLAPTAAHFLIAGQVQSIGANPGRHVQT